MNASGYQFFVATDGKLRLPVRQNRDAVRRDRDFLGQKAKIVPLLASQAKPLIAADRRALHAFAA